MKRRIHHKIKEGLFDHDTSLGRIMDVFFFIMILGSLVIVMLDSVPHLNAKYHNEYLKIEWVFTIVFTIEYMLRLSLHDKPLKFALSFLGIVDLISIIPTYLTLFFPDAQPLLEMRALRLLRVFRIFRLSHFLHDFKFLSSALANSFRKISIFFMFALIIVIIMASIMYLVEDPKNGFTSIPECMYWAIVTITTVGYGDLVPVTAMGKVVANILMLIGYAIIAVPTGIITTEMALAIKSRETGHDKCKNCNKGGHDFDAAFCKHCGNPFDFMQEDKKDKAGQ